MKKIKTLLFKILSLKNYLRVLHKSFHFLYSKNYLKNDSQYRYHYFDKKVIQKGDVIIDLGANLGYYTILFAKWTGSTGKVYAVEPVSHFAETIKWAARKYPNVELYPYALGTEEKEVMLGTGEKSAYLRTGLLHVIDQNDAPEPEGDFLVKAQMKRASILFKDIPRLDFIKCDIEGYEEFVLPEMVDLIRKFKPVIQLETWGDHRSVVEKFLLENGYEIYNIEEDLIKPLCEMKEDIIGDFFFIHKENNSIIERVNQTR